MHTILPIFRRLLKRFHRFLLSAALFSSASLAYAQSLVIPQIADGGGWQTTLVITNTTAASATASLNFYQETGGGATQYWNPPLLEPSNPQNLSLPGAGTIFLHTPGTAPVTSQGWAQFQASSGVVCYAIFTQRVPGRQDQDGTAPAVASSIRILVPFDNTTGFVTSLAIVNPTFTSESVAVSIQTTSGAISQGSISALPAQGHLAFAMPQQFPVTTGQRGLAEFYSSTGSIAIIALRFNPTGALTTAPVYSQAGPPIIGGKGGPSGSVFYDDFSGPFPGTNWVTLIGSITIPNIDTNVGNPPPSLSLNHGATFQSAVNPFDSTGGLTFSFDVVSPKGSAPSSTFLFEIRTIRAILR
jgi:hypothetical protein